MSYIHIYSIYRVIHKSLRDFRPLRYSSRDGHTEDEHINRGRDTPSFCPNLQMLDMSNLGDASDVNPVNKFLPHTVNHVALGACKCLLRHVIDHSCGERSRRQSLLSTARCCNVVRQELVYRIDICRVTKGGHIKNLWVRTETLSVSPSVDMLPFGVTIPATVPQRSEIPEGLMNYPVYVIDIEGL
jgi:hypothetical protein